MTVLETPPTVAVTPSRRPRRGRSVLAWVSVLAVCGALFGVAVASTLPASYVAEGSLLVSPLRGNAYAGPGDKLLTDLETESQLVSSDAVLRRVASDGGAATPSAEVRNRLRVGVVTNATVLTIRYKGSTPEEARSMVLRLAAATLAERVERSRAAGAQQAEVIEQLLADAQADQDRILAKAKDDGVAPSTAQLRLTTERQDALNAEYLRATGDPGYPGRLITAVVHGDGGVKKLRIGLVGGSVLLAVVIGVWVGRSSRSRTHQ